MTRLRRDRILPKNRADTLMSGRLKKDWILSWISYADLILKVVSTIAFAVAALWGYSQYKLAGGDDWMINLDIQTEVFPYKDDLRILAVHVKSRNPRNIRMEFDKGNRDAYNLIVRKIPAELKAGVVAEIDKGDLIGKVDLMPDGVYSFVQNGEFDDMAVFILPVSTVVSLSAELTSGGDDFVSTQKVIEVKP